MIQEEVTMSVEEWLGFGEHTKELLLSKSPIKQALDFNLKVAAQVLKDFQEKQQKLLETHAIKDELGQFKMVGENPNPSDLNSYSYKNKKLFFEELRATLVTHVTLKVNKVSQKTTLPYQGLLIDLKTYLEINTELTPVDSLFLMKYYLTD